MNSSRCRPFRKGFTWVINFERTHGVFLFVEISASGTCFFSNGRGATLWEHYKVHDMCFLPATRTLHKFGMRFSTNAAPQRQLHSTAAHYQKHPVTVKPITAATVKNSHHYHPVFNTGRMLYQTAVSGSSTFT